MPYIRINNRKNFLLEKVPEYHPASNSYKKFWRVQMKRIIEGYWAPDDKDIKFNLNSPDYSVSTEKWRWMTPNLYFYINFGTIEHKPEGMPKTAPKVKMRPLLRDIEWELFYNLIECRGFSGFEDDDEFTCLEDVQYKDIKKLHPSAINSKGEIKRYIPTREYLRKLHVKPMGRPIYQNDAKNFFWLASRECGKSFSIGVGLLLHEIITDGRKYYNLGDKLPIATLFVGSGISSKSQELMRKVESGMRNLPGIWKPNTDDEEPSPLFKKMSGSIKPNSKWIHDYEKKIGGSWKWSGSGSHIQHGVFTSENPEAAAGGRYTVIVVEEVGLTNNVLRIHASNDAAQYEGTVKFGSSIYIGTGGSLEKIVESEEIFRDPENYDCLAFEDEWEGTGKIGWFTPAYYKDNEFKDENGNTDIEAARQRYLDRRKKKKKAKDRSAIDIELMNYPLVPSEMFISAMGSYFPIDDLKRHYGDLLANQLLLDASWRVEFGLDENGNVREILSDKPIIREFPYRNERGTDCAIEIFERPKTGIDGKIPFGRYICGNDPVDDDDISTQSSLQSSFILDTFTDRIVAEYTARPRLAKDYYEQLRRLLKFYNARCNYEKDKKGLFAHFEKKNSLYLLADTPKILEDKDLQKINYTGNQAKGTRGTAPVNKWALELIQTWLEKPIVEGDSEKMQLQTIRSPALLKELYSWRPDGNFDRISALGMLMIYREDVWKVTESRKNKKDKIRKVSSSKFWNKAWGSKVYNK